MEAILPDALPVVLSRKSSVETSSTSSLKVTVYSTEAALAAGEPLGAILVTLGATASMTMSLLALSEFASPGVGRVTTALLPSAS